MRPRKCVIIDCGAFYPEERTAITNISGEQLKFVSSSSSNPWAISAIISATTPSTGVRTEAGSGTGDEKPDEGTGQSGRNLLPDAARHHFLLSADSSREDEVIKFGNHEFQVIETPGHSNGSVTFHCEAEHVAFTDTLFQTLSAEPISWRQHVPHHQQSAPSRQLPDENPGSAGSW